jgi:hypothetical protein
MVIPLLGVLAMVTASAGPAFSQDLGPSLRFTHPGQWVYVEPFEKAPDGKITIEFRFKIEEAGSGLQNLVGDDEGAGDFCCKIYFNGDTRKIYAYLKTTDVFTAISPEIIAPGYWYHVACVADGASLTLYLNGEMVLLIPYSGGLVHSDNALYIGSDETEPASLATIDEVRFWNTVRTEQQINHCMHRRIEPGDADFSDLNAYWRLDEGAGSTATDMTDNHRDGTMAGTPKWVEQEACDGDFKGDGCVDGSDLASFVNAYGLENCGSDEWTCPGDFNADGNVDESDLGLFANSFGGDDCKPKHVYAIVDAMVAESPYTEPLSLDYTGLRFGECTGPYVPGLIGTQMVAVDVNTGIGGSTTGIWARYEYVPLNWAGPVLVDIAVTHWPDWEISCPDGWEPASGMSEGHPGALTTGTETACWCNGLCVRYEPFHSYATFISNLCLSNADGSIPPLCETDGVFWPMEIGGIDIHRGCGDSRWVFLGHNNASPWPPMPHTINLNDEEKYTLLETHAPRVWLHSEEIYMPSSVEWAFPNLNRYLNLGGNYWLRTNDPLPEPSDVLSFFHGDLNSAPVYAYFIEKQIPVGEINVEVADLVYFFYYPYNRGKEVFFTIWGNHVGDWEHITVRLAWQHGDMGWEFKASQVYVSAHDFGGAYYWDSPEIHKVDTHPVVYSAWGSHGLWASPGDHIYDTVPVIGTPLIDACDAGTAWDTWENMVAFDYYDPAGNTGNGLGGSQWPAWMGDDFSEPGCDPLTNPGCDADPPSGAIYRWGNTEAGCDSVVGACRLENGPTGPVSKGVMTSLALQ